MVALSVGAAGCGPVEYVREVTGSATAAVARAKEAGAEKAAPYEYTAAVQYLDKAREEGGYAEYQTAIEYGRRAEESARKARVIAERKAKGETVEDEEEAAPSPSPAKHKGRARKKLEPPLEEEDTP